MCDHVQYWCNWNINNICKNMNNFCRNMNNIFRNMYNIFRNMNELCAYWRCLLMEVGSFVWQKQCILPIWCSAQAQIRNIEIFAIFGSSYFFLSIKLKNRGVWDHQALVCWIKDKRRVHIKHVIWDVSSFVISSVETFNVLSFKWSFPI